MAAAARLLNDIVGPGDCKKVRQYIKKGYDCNARQSATPHLSLLHLVASLTCNDCDIGSTAHAILKGGAAVDAKEDHGVTPLMMCAISGNERVASVLLQADADVHAVCNQQRTALHWAAVMRCTTLIQLILAAGASAAAASEFGALALHAACNHGADCDLQTIKQLVSHGPALINTYCMHSSGKLSVTPLSLAVSNGCSTEVAAYLISSGADVNATDLIRASPLMFPRELSMVQLLLEAGAGVNTRDSFGNTVLHKAAHFGLSASTICCLLKSGADATAIDSTGSTAAAGALAHGHTATAALLQRAEAGQRDKQQQQQQQQQRAVPLPAERQILNSWQSSIDMRQRHVTVYDIVDCLDLPEGGQWRSFYIDLIAQAEFELYRRAADIAACSDVSTLQHRLNGLVADGVMLQTQLKQYADAETVTDSTTAQSSTIEAAASTADAAATNSSNRSNPSESVTKGISSISSSSSPTNAISAEAYMTASVSHVDCTGAHTADGPGISSSDSTDSGSSSAVDASSSSSSSSSNSTSSSIQDKWASMTMKLLQLDAQRSNAAMASYSAEPESVAVDITGSANNSNSSSGGSSGGNNCSVIDGVVSNGSSSEDNCDSITKQLLALQAQRVAAAHQQVIDTALAATSAAAAVVKANVKVIEHETDSDVCAVAAAIAGAEAAALSASEACSAQAAACKQLQIEMRVQAQQRQCVAGKQHVSSDQTAVATVVAATTVTAVSDELDSDDDCPPLAHAGAIALPYVAFNDGTSSTASILNSIKSPADSDAAEAALAATNDNNSSISSSDRIDSSNGDSVHTEQQQQPKQSVQQPCVHCGKMTKKRCRRCQAVYYCSEECQIKCFKDPEHRAQCEAIAVAVTAPQA
jgi:ankyrin repeat protein